jgi:hypothetical protein
MTEPAITSPTAERSSPYGGWFQTKWPMAVAVGVTFGLGLFVLTVASGLHQDMRGLICVLWPYGWFFGGFGSVPFILIQFAVYAAIL